MEIKSLKKYWQIFVFNTLIVLCFVIFYGHFGNIIVDSFREAYIPEQILKGQVLYKNIFCIYAPFAYLFNTFLFMIFGVKLQVLYFAGLAAVLCAANLIYKISEIFYDKNSALAVVLFTIAASVLSPNVFNMFFPYSFGVLYGLVFVLVSIYCALKQKFPLAYLFYSFAVCSKYEFILLLPLLVYASGKKNVIKNAAALVLPILLTFIPLFLSGTTIKDLIISLNWILVMSSTKTLYWFYSVTGLVFRPQLIPIYIVDFVKIAIPVSAMYFLRTYFIIPFLIIYLWFFVSPEMLVFVFPLILILFAIRYRKLDFNQKFIVLASLIVSIKLFFALTFKSYGVYFIPFALISIFVLIPERFRKSILIITLLSALVLGIQNGKALYDKNIKIQTPRGVVYVEPEYGNAVSELIKYLDKNTATENRVLVYPECLAVNFLSERDSDNKFYSLIPLYVETFGDDLIIKRLEAKKPEYIVILNYDTSDYYYSFFGQDYAGEIFLYIIDNYEYKTKIGNKFTIYKLK